MTDRYTMKLQVLVSTYGHEGLARVREMTLPHVPGVGYLVVCQGERCDSGIARDDVDVRFIDGRGLSANRNAALDMATAPVVLIADDDLHYTATGLKHVMDAFDRDAALSLAAFMHEGADARTYPPAECDLRPSRPGRRHYPYSFEIALRLGDVRRHNLRFSELAGINAPFLGAGEEDLFVHHALEKGLRGRFIPKVVVRHPGHTTVMRTPTPAVARARGAVLRILYPRTALLRMARLALTHGVPWRHMWQGWLYAGRHRREL